MRGHRGDQLEQRGRHAVEVPLQHVAIVDPHLYENRLRVDIARGHDAGPDRDRHPLCRGDRSAVGGPRAPVVHERVAEHVGTHLVGGNPRSLVPDHRGHHRFVVEPGGSRRPRHRLFGPDDVPLHVQSPRREQGMREQRGQDARLRHAPAPRVVALQGGTGGIHDAASAARDQILEGGGESRMPDGVG